MTPEDRLRAALREAAAPTAPDPAGPEHVLATAAHRRRRTAALSSLAVTALVAIAGIAVFRDDPGAEVRTVPATRTSTTAPPARPSTAVAVTAQGAVVVVDTADGRAVRTLAPEGSADPNDKAARSPDGTTVYFADQAVDCGWSDLFEVPADGSRPPRAVAKGHAPAVSPDGTRLAYATADGCVGAVLVVRDLATGAELSWRAPERSTHLFTRGGISAVEWAPDNRRVAFQMDEHDGVHVLDTLLPGLLTAATPVEPRRQPADTSLGLRSWHPEGGLAVAVQCCMNPDGMTSEHVRTTTRTLLVDVATNEATPLLAEGEYAWSLDYDASGQWLVWLDDGRIVMQGPDGRTRRVAEGFGAVSW